MIIRVLIVDDHRMVREGLRVFLGHDPELVIVGEAADGVEAVEEALHLRPDVVLMDLHLPGMDGISATRLIRRNAAQTKVIILTGIPNSARVFEAMRAGASGFLLKDAEAGEVCSAIRAAVAGQIHLCPQASASLLREARLSEQTQVLSRREAEVLRLLARGYSNKEIARDLHIGEETVRTHVRRIMAKLGVRRRTQAILVAMRLGMIAQVPSAV
ncbi:MAG: response regulator transcription factor [Chloroflexi bacterium]|nr:MAG: response regulator transcription factor [Chloroflexota bacterium]